MGQEFDFVNIKPVKDKYISLYVRGKTNEATLAYFEQQGTHNAASFKGGSGVDIKGVSGKKNALNVYDNQTEYPTVGITNNGSGSVLYVEQEGSGTALFVKQEGSGDLADFRSSGKAQVFVGGWAADLVLEVVPGKEAKDNQPKLTLRQKGDGENNFAVTGELGYFDSTDDLTLINRSGGAFLRLNSTGNIEIGNKDSTIVLMETIKELQQQVSQLQQEVQSMKGGVRSTKTIALQAHNGQYVCAEDGGGREVVADRDEIRDWETFKLIELISKENLKGQVGSNIMTTLADYHVIQDSKFTLEPGESKSFDFNLPNDIKSDGLTDKPILSWRVDSLNANNFELNVEIGENHIYHTTEIPMMYFEPVKHSDIKKGNNRISFRCAQQGSGKIIISDIIAWFKRSV